VDVVTLAELRAQNTGGMTIFGNVLYLNALFGTWPKFQGSSNFKAFQIFSIKYKKGDGRRPSPKSVYELV
jgi:hypothetical protein